MPSTVIMGDHEPRHSEFARLYRATLAPLRRYLTRFLGDPNEAQDVAHDAYLRVYNAESRRPVEKPQALLFTTARNLAINRLQRRHRSPVAFDPATPELAASRDPGVVNQVIARQELQALEQAIAELPPGCRAVLLLRKVEMLSHQEIATRLGIAVSTVEKQHARALRLLKAALAARSIEVPTDSASRSPAAPARPNLPEARS